MFSSTRRTIRQSVCLALAVVLVAPVALAADYPVIDVLQINNGVDPVVPDEYMERSVSLHVEATHDISWDHVYHVDCTITGPNSFQLLDDVYLAPSGPVDNDTATFTGNFVMDFWYPAGPYSVEAVAQDAIGTGGPTYTTSFNYAEGWYVGTYDDAVDFGYQSSGDTVEGLASITNDGNMPFRLALELEPFEDESGAILDLNPRVRTPDGDWLSPVDYLDSTVEPVEAQAMRILRFELTVPEGCGPGTYTSTLTVTAVDGDSSSSLEGRSALLAPRDLCQIPFSVTVVPEPATMSLLALGLGALAVRRRRRP